MDTMRQDRDAARRELAAAIAAAHGGKWQYATIDALRILGRPCSAHRACLRRRAGTLGIAERRVGRRYYTTALDIADVLLGDAPVAPRRARKKPGRPRKRAPSTVDAGRPEGGAP